MTKKNPLFGLSINLGLLLFGFTMVFSGLLIQFGYHMGHHGEIDAAHLALGLNYLSWSAIHKISIVVLSIAMVFHVILHGKWYMTVLRKKALVIKNQQAIILTIVFIFVAITGYLAWFINLSDGPESTSKFFIEIHDKIALVLLVYLLFHVAKRFKWYWTAVQGILKTDKTSRTSEGIETRKRREIGS